MRRLKIGISRCLLGDKVRYDGAAKYSSLCSNNLASEFELVSLCPEVEAGASVPRPPVELIQLGNGVRAIGRDDRSIDVTTAIVSYAQKKLLELGDLAGFIVASRSPSCGFDSVPLKGVGGELINLNSSGLFTRELTKRFPSLPIIEDVSLKDESLFLIYQLRVISYYLLINNCCSELKLIYGMLQLDGLALTPGSVEDRALLLHDSFKQLDLKQLDLLLGTLRGIRNE